MTIIRSMILLLAILPFMGCGTGPGDDSQTTGTTADTKEEPILNFLNWEDYIADEVLEKFKEETGIEVRLTTFGSTEQLEAILQEDHREFDLTVVDHTSLAQFIDQKILAELHHPWLGNLGNLKKGFDQLNYDPKHQWSVPYFTGMALIIYNKEKCPDVPRQWADLWKPEYSGKVVLMEDHWDYLGLGLVKKGYAYTDPDPAHWSEAVEGFAEVLAHCGNLTEFDDALEQVVSGEMWIGTCYNADARLHSLDHPQLGYVLPAEGGMKWTDLLAVVRRAEHPRNAHRFINFLLDPETAAMHANAMQNATVVAPAEQWIEPGIKNDPFVTLSAEMEENFRPFHQMSPNLNAILAELRRLANQHKERVRNAGQPAAD